MDGLIDWNVTFLMGCCSINAVFQNLDLTQDARAARAYRDELDVWKEKASKAEKYENEITKYREKLNELEYLKKRVEVSL